jgi:hypothetical protein
MELSMKNTPLATANREELVKLKELLDNSISQRNTLTMEEFMRFKPLYSRDGVKSLNERDYIKLCKAFQSRISLYHPINVVKRTDHGMELIMQLPAVFTSIDSFNVLGSDAAKVINYFHNATSRENALRRDDEHATSVMMRVLEVVSETESRKELIARDDKIEETTMKQMGKEVEQPPTAPLTDWF